MKKLNPKAFWIILSGIVAAMIYRGIDLWLVRNREYPKLAERMDPQRLQRLTTAMFRLDLVFAIIFAIICIYIIYRLLSNKNKEQKQKYITFLYVVCIINVIISVFSLLFGNMLAFVSLAINIAIIVGCSIQRKQQAGF